MLLGLPQPFTRCIGFLQHAGLSGLDALVGFIPLRLKGGIAGRDGGLKFGSQSFLGVLRGLQLMSHVGADSGYFLLQGVDLTERIALAFGFTSKPLLQFGGLLAKMAYLVSELIGCSQRRISFNDDVIVRTLQRRQVGFQRVAVFAEDLLTLLHRRHPQ